MEFFACSAEKDRDGTGQARLRTWANKHGQTGTDATCFTLGRFVLALILLPLTQGLSQFALSYISGGRSRWSCFSPILSTSGQLTRCYSDLKISGMRVERSRTSTSHVSLLSYLRSALYSESDGLEHARTSERSGRPTTLHATTAENVSAELHRSLLRSGTQPDEADTWPAQIDAQACSCQSIRHSLVPPRSPS